MRAILSEKNLVVVLFILVLVAFFFAHEDSKKMEMNFAGNSKYLNSSNSSLTQNTQQAVEKGKNITSTTNLSQ